MTKLINIILAACLIAALALTYDNLSKIQDHSDLQQTFGEF